MFNFNVKTAASAGPATTAIKVKDAFPGYEGEDFVINAPSYRDPDTMEDARLHMVRQESYAFQPEVLEVVLDYLASPAGDALYVFGPSGSGKTSCITQVAARLCWPVIQMTLNSRFELADLIGHNTIINGEVVFQYGPLVHAMKQGYILLLNEIDLADPGELAGLNDILEGRPLSIIQNGGEVVKPHPMFRLVCTANTAGSGATAGNYAGTGILNSAFLDRFRFIEVGYMPSDMETALIKGLFPALEDKTAANMIRFANEIRRSHLSQGESSVYMTSPLTTRVVIRWAHIITESHRTPERSLDVVFGSRLSGDEKIYLHRLFKDIWGDEKPAEASADATA